MTRIQPNSSGAGSARSRYPGTRPFSDSSDDYARFFGRAEETEQLYLRVLSVPLLLQFGKSGLGKTSLLQAGLFPRLRQKPFLPVMVRLNVSSESLALAVARSIRQTCEAEGLEFTDSGADGLWELLSTTTVWRGDLLLTPVLVFDQFEEVFSLRDAAFRAALAAELGALASGIAPKRLHAGRPGVAEPVPRVKIVISLREDYLGALQELSAAIPGLFQERLRLEPLTEDAAREAITGPAQLTAGAGEEPYWAPRFAFEPPVLASMIAYLKGNSGVIEPFQLQLLCRHAEAIAHGKSRQANDSVTLAPADVIGSNGFDSVLKNFYRDTLLKLPRSQRKKAEELCEEGLLNVSGHRLMLEEAQIRGDFDITPDTLTILSQERLVRRERRNESVFYEISHDRLAESILKSRRFRLPKKVRRALWTAGIAAPVLLAVLLAWAFSLDMERKRAEQLLGFLLGEKFLGGVRDVGRSAMLEQVREQTKDSESDSDQRAASNRGLALRNAGDLERMKGWLAKSIALFERALKVIESNPDHPDIRREAARTRERLAEALSDQGQFTQALAHYEAAESAWSKVVGNAAAAATDDCTSLADSLVSAGELKNRMGQADLALDSLEKALRITSAVLFGRQTAEEKCGPVAGKPEPYPDAKALEVLSRAALLRAIILNFREDFDGAATLAMEARRLRPNSVSARRNALTALAWRGNARVSETPQSGLKDYREVLAQFEELRRLDPNNGLWQRERAATQLLVSEGILACHESKTKSCKPMPSLEEAEATMLEAIATLLTLAQTDPSNVSLQSDLRWALQDHAKVLKAQGRKAERLAILETSERIYGQSKPDSADAETVAALGRLLLDKSDALAALGKPGEAAATLQRSVDLFKGLIAAHPDHPTYVADLSAARGREAEIGRKMGARTGAAAAEREAARLNEQYENLIRRGNQKADELNDSYATRVNEGAKLFKAKDYVAALREFNAAAPFTRDYIRLRPTAFRGYENLRNVYGWIEVTQKERGLVAERAAPLSAAMHAARIAALLAPEDSVTEMNNELLDTMHSLGVVLYTDNRLAEALAMVQEEVVIAEAWMQGTSQNAHYYWRLGNAKFGLGIMRRELDRAGWKETIQSSLIHIQKAAEIDPKNPRYTKELQKWRGYLAEQLESDGRKEKPSVKQD